MSEINPPSALSSLERLLNVGESSFLNGNSRSTGFQNLCEPSVVTGHKSLAASIRSKSSSHNGSVKGESTLTNTNKLVNNGCRTPFFHMKLSSKLIIHSFFFIIYKNNNNKNTNNKIVLYNNNTIFFIYQAVDETVAEEECEEISCFAISIFSNWVFQS